MTNKSIADKFVGKAKDSKIETYKVEVGGTDESGEKRTMTLARIYSPKTGKYTCVKNF